MPELTDLAPAIELAGKSQGSFPNESRAYREARTALLAEEIELRRHIERVNVLRRKLPPGGEVPEDYGFEGEAGPARLSEMFGDKQTLVIYSAMYGPKREAPCPVCTSLLEAWNGTAKNVTQRVALAVTARSPIERLIAYKQERGWTSLKVYSDGSGAYTRAYVDRNDGDTPGLSVFTRRDGTIRHFWSGEMGMATADPGQDPRGALEIDPLWTILGLSPEGRGTDWYPKLSYAPAPLVKIK